MKKQISVSPQGEINMTPKYPLGTLFWFIRNNKICRGIIAEIQVSVSSYNPKINKSLSEQIWSLFWFKATKEEKEVLKKAQQTWIRYRVSTEDTYIVEYLVEKKGVFTFNGQSIYSTKEELLKTL